jgi:hypothetical protein
LNPLSNEPFFFKNIFLDFPFVVMVRGLSRKELRYPIVRFDRQEKSGRRISKVSGPER